MTRRPRLSRQNKSDRLVTPGATATEIECDMMLAPFDHACAAMDRKWGTDRLPEIVSVETAGKWGSAMAKLNEAIASGNVEETKLRVGVCVRGLAALDAEAEKLGRVPLPPEVWEVEINGQVVALIRDTQDWHRVSEMRPGVRIHTLREVAVALNWMAEGGHLDQVRQHFPQAEIVKCENVKQEYSDPIPF